MIEDIYEPLSRYRDEFKEKFARLAEEKIDELTGISGVDIQANAVLVSAIKKLQKLSERLQNTRALWACLTTILILLAIASGVIIFLHFSGETEIQEYLLLTAVFVIVLAPLICFLKTIPAYRKLDQQIAELTRQIDSKIAEAWTQMAPLNALFNWSITSELIEKTVPRLQFDRYFTEARLRDLRESFGWDDSLNEDRSVIHSHSGVINGNPFVFGELRRQDWHAKIYTGYLTISWVETVRDSDGKLRRVRRHETLSASISRPAPFYCNEKILIFGNDAAPELSFSRQPSDLSGAEGGIWNGIKRSYRMNKLRKFARNLDDDSNFTMMSNEEFELLFHAKDRSDEIAFRLLFTPLAQQQMVNFLNDKQVGFGDDFSFIKDKKINLIIAEHLNNISFDHNPERFKNYDYKAIRMYFLQYNNAFFKAAYFALAPLLIVPLYQQTRTHSDIYGKPEDNRSAFWEHEALANCYGDDHFEHPDCITQNILKTRRLFNNADGRSTIRVTAHGFRGENRLELVPTYSGDGRWHNVPVEWVEYLPVKHSSNMEIREVSNSAQEKDMPVPQIMRRHIWSKLG